MRALFVILIGLCLVVTFSGLIGCDDEERRSSDGDADTDGDSDSDTGAAITGAMQGVALAPSGAFPIPGALIYLTKGDGPDIPDSIFCYDCEDMTGKKWTLSNSDGTWALADVPVGDWNIVVRKGFFQRQRAVSVSEGQRIACGIASYGSSDIETIQGLRSERIEEVLGYQYGAEVVHRDNLVLL